MAGGLPSALRSAKVPLLLFMIVFAVSGVEEVQQLSDHDGLAVIGLEEDGEGDQGPGNAEDMSSAVAAGVEAAMRKVGDRFHINQEDMGGVMAHVPKDLKKSAAEVGKPDKLGDMVGSTEGAVEESEDVAEAEARRDKACDKANELKALGLVSMASTYEADCRALTKSADAVDEPQVQALAEPMSPAESRVSSQKRRLGEEQANAETRDPLIHEDVSTAARQVASQSAPDAPVRMSKESHDRLMGVEAERSRPRIPTQEAGPQDVGALSEAASDAIEVQEDKTDSAWAAAKEAMYDVQESDSDKMRQVQAQLKQPQKSDRDIVQTLQKQASSLDSYDMERQEAITPSDMARLKQSTLTLPGTQYAQSSGIIAQAGPAAHMGSQQWTPQNTGFAGYPAAPQQMYTQPAGMQVPSQDPTLSAVETQMAQLQAQLSMLQSGQPAAPRPSMPMQPQQLPNQWTPQPAQWSQPSQFTQQSPQPQLGQPLPWSGNIPEQASYLPQTTQQPQVNLGAAQWSPPSYTQQASQGANAQLGEYAGIQSQAAMQVTAQQQDLTQNIMARAADVLMQEQKAKERMEMASQAEQKAQIAMGEAQRTEVEARSISAQASQDTGQAKSILEAAREEAEKEGLEAHREVEQVEERAEEEAKQLTDKAEAKVSELEQAAIEHANLVAAQAASSVNDSVSQQAASAKEEELDQARTDVLAQSKEMHGKVVALRLQVAHEHSSGEDLMNHAQTKMREAEQQEADVAQEKDQVEKMLVDAHERVKEIVNDATLQAEHAKTHSETMLQNAAEKAEQMKLSAEHTVEQLESQAQEEVKKAQEDAAAAKQSAEDEAVKIKDDAQKAAEDIAREAELRIQKEEAEANTAAEKIRLDAEQQAAAIRANATAAGRSLTDEEQQAAQAEREKQAGEEAALQQMLAQARQNATIKAAEIRSEAEQKSMQIQQKSMEDASQIRANTENRITQELSDAQTEIKAEESDEQHRIDIQQQQEQNALRDAHKSADDLVREARKEADERVTRAQRNADAVLDHARAEAADTLRVATVKARQEAQEAASAAQQAASKAETHAQDAATIFRENAPLAVATPAPATPPPAEATPPPPEVTPAPAPAPETEAPTPSPTASPTAMPTSADTEPPTPAPSTEEVGGDAPEPVADEPNQVGGNNTVTPTEAQRSLGEGVEVPHKTSQVEAAGDKPADVKPQSSGAADAAHLANTVGHTNDEGHKSFILPAAAALHARAKAAVEVSEVKAEEEQIKAKAQQDMAALKAKKLKEEMDLVKLAKQAEEKDHAKEEVKVQKLSRLSDVVEEQQRKMQEMQEELTAAKAAHQDDQKAMNLLNSKAKSVKAFADNTAQAMDRNGGYSARVQTQLQSDVNNIGNLLKRENDRQTEDRREKALYGPPPPPPPVLVEQQVQLPLSSQQFVVQKEMPGEKESTSTLGDPQDVDGSAVAGAAPLLPKEEQLLAKAEAVSSEAGANSDNQDVVKETEAVSKVVTPGSVAKAADSSKGEVGGEVNTDAPAPAVSSAEPAQELIETKPPAVQELLETQAADPDQTTSSRDDAMLEAAHKGKVSKHKIKFQLGDLWHFGP